MQYKIKQSESKVEQFQRMVFCFNNSGGRQYLVEVQCFYHSQPPASKLLCLTKDK